MPFSLEARQHVRKMRGGSQAHLLRTEDGGLFVTKLMANPQSTRVLANEMFASGLGRWLGLPIPEVEVIEISEAMIQETPELRFDIGDRSFKCRSGSHLGSRYVIDPEEAAVFDYIPDSCYSKVRNIHAFAQCLPLDRWTNNCDGRQAVFSKRPNEAYYDAWLIDQGYCFGGQEWCFQDLPLHGVYQRNRVYKGVTGWDSFEPALSRAEGTDLGMLWSFAEPIPPEWYDGDLAALHKLVETMYERRSRIRELIEAFRDSHRKPFPNWRRASSCFVPNAVAAATVHN
jgi:hypothetical protein